MGDIVDEFFDKLNAIENALLIVNGIKDLSGLLDPDVNYGKSTMEGSLTVLLRKGSQFPVWEFIAVDGVFLYLVECYEETIRDLIEEGARLTGRITPRYEDLPKAMRDSHRKGLGTILIRHKWEEYEALIIEDIVKRFEGCENQKELNNYDLVLSAFSMHDAHINTKILKELFKRLDVDNLWDKLSNNVGLRRYFRDTGDPEVTKYHTIEKLNGIIRYRNKVAHQSDEHIGPPIIRDYIKFLRVFIPGIKELLDSHFRFRLLVRFRNALK